MKTAILIAATAITSASAFAPSSGARPTATVLFGTGISSVKDKIAGLTSDNFSSTLSDIEPFLTKEAGASIYKKSIRRINTAAKSLGVDVPAGYAKEAKATEKKREKQDAYCKAKAEEAADADASEDEEEAEPPAEEEAPAEE